ncbi:hypothetical protein ACLOJK_011641 [Asimina triloba]
MNRAAKLSSRKNLAPATQTPDSKIQTAKKSKPRNPLKEINAATAVSASTSSSSTSVEVPKGCFRFLLSANSSAKTALPRSKSIPKTPKSAPNPTPKASNFRPKPPQNNPRKPRSQIPQKSRSSYLLHWQNGKKSCSEEPSLVEKDAGKPPQQTFSELSNEHSTSVNKPEFGPCLAAANGNTSGRLSTVPSIASRFRSFAEMSGTPINKMASGSCLDSTPRKALEERPATPPLLHSISPKIDTVKPAELSFRPVLEFSCTPVNKLAPSSCLVSTTGKVLPGQLSPMAPPEMSYKAVFQVNATPINKTASGSQLVSTPDKASEEKSTNTPPVQASISPEIQCGSSLVSTPACFAAGHVVVGVSDRRKCRPRGLLTVGEEVEVLGFGDGRASLIPVPAEASVRWHVSPIEATKKAVVHDRSPEDECLVDPIVSFDAGFSDGGSSVRLSLATPPAEASVNWLLSPCEDVKKGVTGKDSPEFEESRGHTILGEEDNAEFLDGTGSVRKPAMHPSTEDSVNSLLSPHDGARKGIVEMRSLEFEGLVGSTRPVTEARPSSDFEFTCSSIVTATNPPPQIVNVQSAADAGRILLPLEEKEYRYNLASESSPFSGESWGSRNVICTPVSDSSSGRQAGCSSPKFKDFSGRQFESSLMAEVHESFSLSTLRQLEMCDQLESGLNFRLTCQTSPSNSISETKFLKPLYSQKFGIEESYKWEGLTSTSSFENTSQMRISWREGLVSRIFEMDELDSCRWISDGEENNDSCSNHHLKSDISPCFDENTRISTSTDQYDQWLSDCFQSTMFLSDAHNAKKTEEMLPPHGPSPCAESISTDGGGLVSSDDSDWTLLYKNKLFEV